MHEYSCRQSDDRIIMNGGSHVLVRGVNHLVGPIMTASLLGMLSPKDCEYTLSIKERANLDHTVWKITPTSVQALNTGEQVDKNKALLILLHSQTVRVTGIYPVAPKAGTCFAKVDQAGRKTLNVVVSKDEIISLCEGIEYDIQDKPLSFFHALCNPTNCSFDLTLYSSIHTWGDREVSMDGEHGDRLSLFQALSHNPDTMKIPLNTLTIDHERSEE